jgi:hypothetical protein
MIERMEAVGSGRKRASTEGTEKGEETKRRATGKRVTRASKSTTTEEGKLKQNTTHFAY